MKTQNVILIVVGAVLALFLGLSAFLLIRGIGRFARAEAELRREVSTLRDYYARDPFPSERNVEREKENVAVLREWLAHLLGAMREGQVGPVRETPSRFMTLLSTRRIDLVNTARETGVGIPDDFAFGFQRYSASGVLPAPADVPRLAQQLLIIDRICRVLFEARVDGLREVRRDEFDHVATEEEAAPRERMSVSVRGGRSGRRAAAVGGGRDVRDAGRLEEGELFASLRFRIEFTANEQSLLEVLNRLAADEMFIVVTSLRVDKEGDDIAPLPMTAAPPEPDAAARNGPKQALSRRERLVCGPEMEQPLNVGLELEVYRFADSDAQEEG